MPAIHFTVRGVPDAFRERARLRRWLHEVARDHGRTIVDLGYVLLTEEEMLRCNRAYLGHDDHTDVITFPLEDGPEVQGEVLLGHARIKENAAIYKVAMQQELRRVMVHGLLHLLGHADKTPAQRTAMRALEDKYLARWARISA
ncbi:MAG: rRNA maturation RNase YbeY [Flavobacteriales bacterium]|jgi:rRNA maturation RNase YbeY|nr:rRNA maturation RNase YbeY [Flavobacteriales bacterium]